jgi:hypothetical protein
LLGVIARRCADGMNTIILNSVAICCPLGPRSSRRG